MFQKIKKHLFWIVCGVIFALYFAFLAIIFFAPHQDTEERGFVLCTKQMMQDFASCQTNKISCAFKIVLKNNACDFKVIKDGFVLWLDDKQQTPWANYYFEPAEQEDTLPLEDKAFKTYYENHQKIVQEMEELNKKAIELEKGIEK